ncbi:MULTISPECIES: hypothetical protein [unclassified Mesorhizobium]|uniref:hypothetical protein n=1 Tax=unclassified Mesorhizobium TaxID=325217 RepID=UPI001091A435|nr:MULTISPECIES: hypothetical protein [unclassified Mesorhizobium]TGP93851.1 hypothetical protein EN861_17335 [Mesorhizobium sp. M8A.F.Ca.ET.218.01.1.1]TGT18147.1 hypothetical protein EN856_16860 [Mesorhizobium sp. M8A.F.Ca.ET.213.01.1.1]
MTGSDLAALIGIAGTIVGIIVAIVASHRTTGDKIQKGDDALHERINRVRDEYVRRVDLDSHMVRIETNVKELREEGREGTREINRRLDQVLTTLQPRPTPRGRS